MLNWFCTNLDKAHITKNILYLANYIIYYWFSKSLFTYYWDNSKRISSDLSLQRWDDCLIYDRISQECGLLLFHVGDYMFYVQESDCLISDINILIVLTVLMCDRRLYKLARSTLWTSLFRIVLHLNVFHKNKLQHRKYAFTIARIH